MSTLKTVEQPRSLIKQQQSELVPDFMREKGLTGTEQLSAFIRPQRLKVIQAQRAEQYKAHSPGTIVLTPSNIAAAKADEPVYLVPLLFYPEWATVNPLAMKGTLQMIRERTIDIKSELAAKARDPKRWGADPCPEDTTWQSRQPPVQHMLRHVEYMVFVCWLVQKGEVAGQPVLVSFSKGEHQRGQNFATLIKNRQAPIYGCVFEARAPSKERVGPKGSWYGLDVMNPTSDGCPPPFVRDPADFQEFERLHESYKAAYLSGLEQADLGEDEVAEDVAAGERKF